MEIYTRTIESKPGWRKLTRSFSTHGITVPRGFEWDGTSSPRSFWPVIPPYHKTIKASCVHDYLCRKAKTRADRRKADRLFAAVLRDDDRISPPQSWLGYVGVRIGALLGIGNRFDAAPWTKEEENDDELF